MVGFFRGGAMLITDDAGDSAPSPGLSTNKSTAWWRLGRFQTTILALLLAVLSILAIVEILLSLDIGGFTWTLTPTATAAVLGVMSLLVALAAWTLLWRSRSVLTALSLALLVFDLGFSVAFWGKALLLPVAALIALTVCNAVGAREARGSADALTAVFGAVVVVGAVGICVIAGFFALGAFAVESLGGKAAYVYEAGPEDKWTLTAVESDYGALSGFYETVIVQRDRLGIVHQERVIYSGEGERVTAAWKDGKTVVVNGVPVEIFKDPMIEDYPR